MYKDTKELYSNTGNPSIDPVVYYKLLLTGNPENIPSNRNLVDHCAMRMDVLYFLGFNIDEELPWHSTISQTSQLYPAAYENMHYKKITRTAYDEQYLMAYSWQQSKRDKQIKNLR